MRTLTLLLWCAVCTAVCFSVNAQQPTVPHGMLPNGMLPHRVALVDMAHVFKNYKKFDVLTSALRKEVEQSDADLGGQIEQIKELQAKLDSGVLAEGSPERKQLETDVVQRTAAVQSRRQVLQRDFLTKEAEIYKTVYLETQDAVSGYAKQYGYTLVLQYSRSRLDESDDPRSIMEQLNNPVVFHSSADDATDAIVGYLNDRWQRRQSLSPASGSASPGFR